MQLQQRPQLGCICPAATCPFSSRMLWSERGQLMRSITLGHSMRVMELVWYLWGLCVC